MYGCVVRCKGTELTSTRLTVNHNGKLTILNSIKSPKTIQIYIAIYRSNNPSILIYNLQKVCKEMFTAFDDNENLLVLVLNTVAALSKAVYSD